MDLIEAAYNGEVERVKELLDSGADRNFQDKDGYTALWMATSERDTEIVRLLLDRGADPDIRDYGRYSYHNKENALIIASFNGDT